MDRPWALVSVCGWLCLSATVWLQLGTYTLCIYAYKSYRIWPIYQFAVINLRKINWIIKWRCDFTQQFSQSHCAKKHVWQCLTRNRQLQCTLNSFLYCGVFDIPLQVTEWRQYSAMVRFCHFKGNFSSGVSRLHSLGYNTKMRHVLSSFTLTGKRIMLLLSHLSL